MAATVRHSLLALLGIALVAVAARIAFALPGTSVPQTAQTLAVLVVGALLGPRLGAVALAGYLLLGALGVPLFAGGGSGLGSITGRTGGFLLGFLPAAALAGWWVHERIADGRHITPGRSVHVLAGLLLAHALILACGWLRLAFDTGIATAYAAGVAPFLAGAAVKSVLAALVVLGVRAATAVRRRRLTPE